METKLEQQKVERVLHSIVQVIVDNYRQHPELPRDKRHFHNDNDNMVKHLLDDFYFYVVEQARLALMDDAAAKEVK